MKRLISVILILSPIVFTILLLSSCANIGSISGGPKDSIPPEMLGSRPAMNDTSFADKKIDIYFDEYFELKDINQEFVASPPFKEKPDFKIRKRSLRIKFNEPLKDSVTYTLKFGNAVADYNEGNILKDFQFVFSTKNEIDSFAIQGNLKNAFDLKVPENTFVLIFENNEDSIPFKSLSSYVSKIDSSGNFSIDHIRPGAYKIFALSDLNTNKIADSFEPRAFLDSLIIPDIEPFTKIDSIKAGTILHDTEDVELSDSLERDTVIITNTYKTLPSNIQLYLFEEENFKQRVLDYTREERGKIGLIFELPIDSGFSLKPLNFEIAAENYLLEKNLKGDTITWWINDTTIMAKDSLEIDVAFNTIDSLGDQMLKHDTLLLEFRKKKDKDAWKRKKEDETEVVVKEYLKLSYLAKEKKVEMDKKLRIESPIPLINVDTSRMRLFEIYDTTSTDPKKQEIVKAYRLKKDQLQFKFRRPVAKDFTLHLLNFEADNWYTSSALDSNRIYNCRITNQEIAQTDTIKLVVNYDNHFFFDQIQVLSDSVSMPITPHKILSRKRDEAEKIVLVFDKPVLTRLEVIPDDFFAKGNWYRVAKSRSSDTITINLTSKEISNKDTLTFAVRCFDHLDINNDSIYFEETMRLTYSDTKQFLVMAQRIKSDDFKLVFNKKLEQTPTIETIGFTLNTRWHKLEKNEEGDTLSYHITDDFVSSMDTLNLIFRYKDTDRKNNVTNFADTLELVSRKKFEFNKKTQKSTSPKDDKPKEETVSVYLPRKFELTKDSLYIRQRLLNAEWKAETKYLLRLDSLAFVNIYDVYNKAEDYEFSTREEDYYTTLALNLTNIRANKKVTDVDSLSVGSDSITTALDSTALSVPDSIEEKEIPKKEFVVQRHLIDSMIGEGNIIVQLLGKEQVVVKEYFISEDQEILMDFLHPGDYELRIIYDRNNNGKWDTGNYFEGIQPERVIMNGKILQLKSNFENKLTWDAGKTLIQSFSADGVDQK